MNIKLQDVRVEGRFTSPESVTVSGKTLTDLVSSAVTLDISKNLELEILEAFQKQLSKRGLTITTALRLGNEAILQEAYIWTLCKLIEDSCSSEKQNRRIKYYFVAHNPATLVNRLRDFKKNNLL